MTEEKKIPFEQICFGLDRKLDEQSLVLFLRLFTQDKLLDTLIPRLAEDEIMGLVQKITELLHKHLAEKEYHKIFLGDEEHSH
jgi:TorA maturation chaperone TorD